MDKKLLGKRINMARKERGWTGERLAETCSINATYLRQIEAGSKVPSLPVFVSLCQALNVSPTYLLVEVLPQQGNQDMDALLELLQTATPKQLNMMASMIRSALEASKECRNPSQIETGFDIRGNYSTVSMAVYCIDPSSTFTNGLLSHYFASEAGINDQNP